MSKKEKIIDIIREMDTDDVVEIHNEYCEKNKYDEYKVYPIEFFNEYGEGMTPLEIAQCARDGLDPNDDYFYYTIYGLRSFSYIDEAEDVIDVGGIAEYIVDNEDPLGNDEIKEALAEEDE